MLTSVMSKLKKPCIILLTIIILIIIVLISTSIYRKVKQQEYVDNVELTLSMIDTDANFAYDRHQLICKVWINSLLEKRDSETDQYTFNNGDFLDVKSALYNLFNDEDFAKQVNAAKSRMIYYTQDRMDELRELLDKHKEIYPKEYEDFYNSLVHLCDIFSQIVLSTVNNPTAQALWLSSSDWMTYYLDFYDILSQ